MFKSLLKLTQPSYEVEITFDDEDKRAIHRFDKEKGILDLKTSEETNSTFSSIFTTSRKIPPELPMYLGIDDICGKVTLTEREPGKGRLEYSGIRLELIGRIELQSERGTNHDFLSITKELETTQGVLVGNKTYSFAFKDVDKIYESYYGETCGVRYFVRITVQKMLAANLTKEKELFVFNYSNPPIKNDPIKGKVGIENCMHIEYLFGKSKYQLTQDILGNLTFLLVRIKIKYALISIIRREMIGKPDNLMVNNKILKRFEIMDGAPVKGEVLPIRIYLKQFPNLTPTYRQVNSKFSVIYYMNIQIVDTEDRHYFKQHEITLWRKKK